MLTRRRRSVTLEDRLRGRLATVAATKTHNQALAAIALRRQYGERLAMLAESGNRWALRLIGLIDRRRQLGGAGALLEELERPITNLSKMLGLGTSDEVVGVMDLVRIAGSPGSFNSLKQFKTNLTEGLLLNVTKLASDALAIPSGEYLVWTTDVRRTMLVPTSEAKIDGRDVLSNKPHTFDVLTPALLGCWNKVERCFSETSSGYDDAKGSYENPASGDERIGRPALKRKAEAAGGVRATAELTGLSPGDVSKHINNREFEISGDSARSYMRGIGADPDDLYKYGQVKIFDYDTDDIEARQTEREREEGHREYERAERERGRRAKGDERRQPEGGRRRQPEGKGRRE